jgi:hypothetical protein
VWLPSTLESLRAQVRQIESHHRRATPSLPFGVTAVGSTPRRGTAAWRMHEIAGGGNGATT